MKTITGAIRTDKVGSDCYFEFEVDDDATESEIEEMVKECAFERVEWWYEVSEQTK